MSSHISPHPPSTTGLATAKEQSPYRPLVMAGIRFSLAMIFILALLHALCSFIIQGNQATKEETRIPDLLPERVLGDGMR